MPGGAGGQSNSTHSSAEHHGATTLPDAAANGAGSLQCGAPLPQDHDAEVSTRRGSLVEEQCSEQLALDPGALFGAHNEAANGDVKAGLCHRNGGGDASLAQQLNLMHRSGLDGEISTAQLGSAPGPQAADAATAGAAAGRACLAKQPVAAVLPAVATARACPPGSVGASRPVATSSPSAGLATGASVLGLRLGMVPVTQGQGLLLNLAHLQLPYLQQHLQQAQRQQAQQQASAHQPQLLARVPLPHAPAQLPAHSGEQPMSPGQASKRQSALRSPGAAAKAAQAGAGSSRAGRGGRGKGPARQQRRSVGRGSAGRYSEDEEEDEDVAMEDMTESDDVDGGAGAEGSSGSGSDDDEEDEDEQPVDDMPGCSRCRFATVSERGWFRAGSTRVRFGRHREHVFFGAGLNGMH